MQVPSQPEKAGASLHPGCCCGLACRWSPYALPPPESHATPGNRRRCGRLRRSDMLGEPHAHLRWMSSAPDALPIGTRACELAELVSRALGRLWHVGWRHTFLSRCQFAAAFQRQKIRVGRAALLGLPWSRSCRRGFKFARVRTRAGSGLGSSWATAKPIDGV